ncbi:hypothetical protein F0P96_08650 [Hymenobacter busanensis]|uniref:Uncharacterized protein n=1 Tax=Hymenobacter busanensis TaxID=2607656 RepID=A0A7L4ZYD2_9BACT|nr:hypothetical protein [Hymenobacter busanensis]KAA9333044.1 hypothetical protein F0P96_08650 [Hymenobacter busanensis]QHJ08281.1 hypothetical protein GUY19_13675 [Hymenobacter busanensis]
MVTKRTSFRWVLAWLLFYGLGLPYCVPVLLDWLNRPSDRWVVYGMLGMAVVGGLVALSLYQAARALLRRFQPPSTPSSTSYLHERDSTRD